MIFLHCSYSYSYISLTLHIPPSGDAVGVLSVRIKHHARRATMGGLDFRQIGQGVDQLQRAVGHEQEAVGIHRTGEQVVALFRTGDAGLHTQEDLLVLVVQAVCANRELVVSNSTIRMSHGNKNSPKNHGALPLLLYSSKES